MTCHGQATTCTAAADPPAKVMTPIRASSRPWTPARLRISPIGVWPSTHPHTKIQHSRLAAPKPNRPSPFALYPSRRLQWTSSSSFACKPSPAVQSPRTVTHLAPPPVDRNVLVKRWRSPLKHYMSSHSSTPTFPLGSAPRRNPPSDMRCRSPSNVSLPSRASGSSLMPLCIFKLCPYVVPCI
jgi:hypothetical protein